MQVYEVSDVPNNQEISSYVLKDIKSQFAKSLQGFTFYEFTLEELGLPTHDHLLKQTQKLEKLVGLQGWKVRGKQCPDYKGMSLTYNEDFNEPDTSVYHQTLGMLKMKHSYSKSVGGGDVVNKKNGYYDTYGFRHIHDCVYDLYKPLFDKINGPISRGRISYFYPHLRDPYDDRGWHIDEDPTKLCRINIPLQTNSNHIIRMKGDDGYGNSFEMEKHFEVGKAYIWNTKIPHEVTFMEKTSDMAPRIHMVMGFLPWLNYNKDMDCFWHSDNYGKTMHDIISNRLFIK